jgi:hypothetical protein
MVKCDECGKEIGTKMYVQLVSPTLKQIKFYCKGVCLIRSLSYSDEKEYNKLVNNINNALEYIKHKGEKTW